jgi:guanylate kinase
VRNRLDSGGDVVCIIEVQGALKIRSLFPDSLLVFLKPPPGREDEILRARIAERGAETDEQTARRMQTAAWELEQTRHYDYQIVNDEIEYAAQQLCDIIAREKAARGL